MGKIKDLRMNISACGQCPYMAIATLQIREPSPLNKIFYCDRKLNISAPQNAIEYLQLLANTVVPFNEIPDWCPLPTRANLPVDTGADNAI